VQDVLARSVVAMSAAATDYGRSPEPRRVLLLGATGTIGRASVDALVARGHEVVCFVRPRSAGSPPFAPEGATVRHGEVVDPGSLAREGIRGERFDVLLSCLASRTGAPGDAWAVDHQAHVGALAAARHAGVRHVVLLSAICVQKPALAFQHAKLAFEAALVESGLTYSIVRPTAYFKSLSGQVERVRQAKPFLLFGDGRQTASKPIGEADLARYLAECLDDPARRNRILPVGGPGEAITPREQGEHLFALFGRKPRFRSVPLGLLDAIVKGFGGLAAMAPRYEAKAEFARIARYYATQSMLVLDPVTGRYDAAATPSYGTQTLFDHYARLVRGEASDERGAHAIF